MNNENSTKQNTPAIPGSPDLVVRRLQPGQYMFNKAAILKAARKEAQRRYQRNWHKEHDDELTLALNKARAQKASRLKAGISLELPKMKPWDFKKGRVV